jgi:SAM-dependent methyltransferase
MTTKKTNIDQGVVDSFGDEWTRFDQSRLEGKEYDEIFSAYFRVFPWNDLPPEAVGFDLGCGSGRWAKGVAPRVGKLHCIDAAAGALAVARRNLAGQPNVEFHHASVDSIPLADGSMDFGYSLGVLHHVPDTAAGMKSATAKLKPGAPFLVYLYYAFDNKGAAFRAIWKISEIGRFVISRSPRVIRNILSEILARLVYWPLARISKVLAARGMNVDSIPLSAYRDLSFYTMRTDALDRFGTRLEQRFTRVEIDRMMRDAGLENVRFSDGLPYWCAVGTKKRS